MRILFMVMLFLHLLIHLIGFAKANQWMDTASGTKMISQTQGILWLLVSILLLVTIILLILRKPAWILLSIPVVITSQILIILNWDEAKYGTILNLIILVVLIFSIAGWKFENKYKEDKVQAILSNPGNNEIISKKDLEHLPVIVQNYLVYSGFVGKPKIENFQLSFTGEMREQNKKWFKFRSEQLNIIKSPARYFFMKAIFKGIPTKGYHRYDGTTARMTIKPFSIFKVIDIQTRELLISEMVTWLNDLCIFSPGALIDKKFAWEEIGENTVKVKFGSKGKEVSAVLEINEKGQLINFFSNDRYSVDHNKQYMFSTPVGGYQNFNGYRLASYGEAVWHYPEADFVYGKFELKKAKYNLHA